ncbi:DUF6600 domain-containing protein [Pedobacter sp. GR22-10]|uniref:DUF6600 domain-containing protein n=1 Tax=Pedobacter sp. GR22-10 TaxID=2994472 RepID=UPI0022465CDE|nr:DUF6600 domain-containing protein [Pedobacter sp. GR22-10]MCX2433326.1 hypothetical protein [Pedobacter sp. GR22-10]
MKTLKKSAIVLGLFTLLAGTTTLVRAQDYQNDYQNDGYSTGNVSLQTFYDELTPYGTWIQDPQYGYVWRPDVDQNEFRPYYTNGRWAMTEYGNTWVSNYDWGWAPFHYGRWVINSYRQWIWLPDTNWGPAWVDWRSGDGYYGWAPMAPSININLSFGRRYSVPEFCWNFIPQRNIYINTFPRYDYGRNNVYIRNTTIINNTYVYNRRSYYGGPRVEDIRRATNRDVTVYRFDQSSRPGASRIGGREVSIYRPRPERNAVDNRNAAPRRFEQGNAGIGRGGRNDGLANRDPRGGTVNNQNGDNRVGVTDNRNGRPNRGNDAGPGNTINQPNRGEAYDKNTNGRIGRGNTNGVDQRNTPANISRGQGQQQVDQMRQQRAQQDRMSIDQQRAQRDIQVQQQRGQLEQQQRSQQMEQQRAQRNEQMQQQRNQQVEQQRSQQMEQQRAQRNEQMQQQRNQQAEQQRSQQMEQQRAQRNEQMQQQRNQQVEQQRSQQLEQQRAQRNEQMQQQRNQQMEQQRSQQMQQRQEQRRTESAPPPQRGGGEAGRPSRGGRG